MRLVTFEANGAAPLGAVAGDGVVDLARAAPDLPGDLLGLIRGGEAALRRAADAAGRADAAARRPLDGLRHLLPLANPGKVVCLGLNYVDHAAEGGHAR